MLAACTARPAGGPPRVPVSVARAELRAIPYEIDATGTVEPLRTVAVASQVGGMLRRVRFSEGDDVAAGQVLFEIDPRPYTAALQQAHANLSRDVVQAANAARDAGRYRELVASVGCYWREMYCAGRLATVGLSPRSPAPPRGTFRHL